jgi:hypothetical protein
MGAMYSMYKVTLELTNGKVFNHTLCKDHAAGYAEPDDAFVGSVCTITETCDNMLCQFCEEDELLYGEDSDESSRVQELPNP